jgi:hypothetical protein
LGGGERERARIPQSNISKAEAFLEYLEYICYGINFSEFMPKRGSRGCGLQQPEREGSLKFSKVSTMYIYYVSALHTGFSEFLFYRQQQARGASPTYIFNFILHLFTRSQYTDFCEFLPRFSKKKSVFRVLVLPAATRARRVPRTMATLYTWQVLPAVSSLPLRMFYASSY